MEIHFFFLFIYVVLAQFFPGEVITGVLILHCVINMSANIKNIITSLNLSIFYNLGVALTSFANVLFINKVKLLGTGADVLHIYNYIDVRFIDEACLVWAVGNTFVFIGYDFFKKKSLPSIAYVIDNRNVLNNMYFVIVAISVLPLTGNAINLGFIAGGFQKILQLLLSVGILFYSRLWVTENNKRFGAYAISMCIFQTIIALYNSYIRIDLITPVSILFLGYFIGKGDVKYLFSVRIVPVIIVFAIFFQFFQTFGTHRAHFIKAFINSDQENSRYSYVENEENAGGTLLERSSCIAQLTHIVKLTKENGFYNGRASLPLLSAVVPRILWPDKPKIELGAWFAVEIGAGTISDETGRANNSVNMTIPGELYLDFSWVGLVLGCILWGGFLSLVWNSTQFKSSEYNLTGTLWGGYLLQGAIGAFVDMQSIITITSTYLVFYLTKKILDHYADTRHRTPVEG